MGNPIKGVQSRTKTLEERQTVAVPTAGQLLAEYLITRDNGTCCCECDLLAAQLLADGVAPEFPEFYTQEAYEIGC